MLANYKVNIFEHLATHKPKTVIQTKDHHKGHKEVLLQHSPLSILGLTPLDYHQDICEFLVDEDLGWCKDRRFLTCRMLCSCS